MGKVTLIGAGPGDASLITVKGLEKLKHCDVVIYDRLASEELLDVVREDCILVYVGKKPGAHSMKQEEINRLLLEYGQKYEDVVRLKGGDPFVFGRGGEEIMALAEAGIAYEVIPGVTSAIAVPELAGIPVTHRGLARSFHVITGHTKESGVEDTLTDDYETLAKLSGTLVFLMGLSNLEKITTELLRFGKSPETPAAVVAEGTTPYERVVRGTLSDITERVREAKLVSPVVIVIGKTTDFSFKCACGSSADNSRSEANGTNAGKAERYGVIGTNRTVSAFRQKMEDAGKAVVPLVTMQVCRRESYDALQKQIADIRSYDWIFFTSRQAVELFFEAFRESGEDVRKLAQCSFAVIGRGTYETLREHGIYADFMPTQADTEAFAKQFVQKYLQNTRGKRKNQGKENAMAEPMRILFPHAVQANPLTGDILQNAGALVTELPVYDVVGKRCGDFSRLSEISDYVFFSASGVRAFFAEQKKNGQKLSGESCFWCIGNPTKEALEQELDAMRTEHEAKTAVCRRIYTADEASVDGLVQKVLFER